MNLPLLSEAAWRLVGWSLLHFLWVGTLAGLAGGALRLACRRAAPTVRYAASLAALGAVVAAAVGCGWWVASQAEVSVVADAANIDAPAAVPPAPVVIDLKYTPLDVPAAPGADAGDFGRDAAWPDTAPTDPALAELSPPVFAESPVVGADPTENSAALLVEQLDAVAPSLPWLWLAGAAATFAWLAAGLTGAARLRTAAAPVIDGPVAAAGVRMRAALRISRHVTVALSERVAQPVLVGIVKPLILLPAAAASGWDAEQLELALAHELAHVRRWDNAVNLVQRIVEAALWFHPAVWLVSRQVRHDREHCCDAAVIAATGRPEAYADLLVELAATLRGRTPAALAAASALGGHPLANRVRRILNLENETMRVSRSTLGAAAALVAAVALVALVLPGSLPAASADTAEIVQDDAALEETPTVEADSTADDSAVLLDNANDFDNAEDAPDDGEQPAQATTILPALGEGATAEDNAPPLSVEEAEAWLARAADGDLDGSPFLRIREEDERRLYEALFAVADDNPATQVVYEIPPGFSQYDGMLSNLLKGLQRDPFGPKLQFDWQLAPTGRHITITAPRRSQKLFRFMFSGHAFPAKATQQQPTQPSQATSSDVSEDPDGSQWLTVTIPDEGNTAEQRPTFVDMLGKQGVTARITETRFGDSKTYALSVQIPAGAEAPRVVWEARYGEGLAPRVIFPDVPPTALAADAYADAPAAGADDEASAKYAVIYKLSDNPNVSLQRWMQLLDKPGVEARWFADKQGLVLVADRATHQQVAAYLNQVRTDEPASPAAGGAAGPFLSPEQQRAADLAYQLLGWELEPLTADELAFVKEHGYAGGLRIEHGQREDGADFLVGLHTRPVHSLTHVEAVLSDPALLTKAPVKFYALCGPRARQGGGYGGPSIASGSLVRGRVEVDANAFKAHRAAATLQASAPPLPDISSAEVNAAPRSARPSKPLHLKSVLIANLRQEDDEELSDDAVHERSRAVLAIVQRAIEAVPDQGPHAVSAILASGGRVEQVKDALGAVLPAQFAAIEISRASSPISAGQDQQLLAIVISAASQRLEAAGFGVVDRQTSQPPAASEPPAVDRYNAPAAPGPAPSAPVAAPAPWPAAAATGGSRYRPPAWSTAPPAAPANPEAEQLRSEIANIRQQILKNRLDEVRQRAQASGPALESLVNEAVEKDRERARLVAAIDHLVTAIHLYDKMDMSDEEQADYQQIAKQRADLQDELDVLEARLREKHRARQALEYDERITLQYRPVREILEEELARLTARLAEVLDKSEAEQSRHYGAQHPSRPVPAPAITPGTSAYLIPSETILIRVAGTLPDQPIDGTFQLDEQGRVALGPVFGRVKIGGMTIEEAEAAVTAHLAKFLKKPLVQITRESPRLFAPGFSPALGDTYPERQTTPAPGPAAVPFVPDAPPPVVLMYDGRTFEQWCAQWRNELNPARRLDAIQAMAAFARAGKGAEAIEAILDVAGEYDFLLLDDTPEGKLKHGVIDLLASGQSNSVDPTRWMSPLLERYRQDPDKWSSFVRHVLWNLSSDDPAVQELLLPIAGDANFNLQYPAIMILARSGAHEDLVKTNLGAWLTGNDSTAASAALAMLYDNPGGRGGLGGYGGGGTPPPVVVKYPDVFWLALTYPAEEVRQAARRGLDNLAWKQRPRYARQALDRLAESNLGVEQQVALLRTLTVLGPMPLDEDGEFAEALPQLMDLVAAADRTDVKCAAILAASNYSGVPENSTYRDSALNALMKHFPDLSLEAVQKMLDEEISAATGRQ